MGVKQQYILEILKQAEKEVTLEVCSNSMEPTINAGDVISVHLSESLAYRRGNIVIFLRGDDVIVHRIIKKKRLNNEIVFCEKGDNACYWTWIAEKDLLGYVVSIADKNNIIKVTEGQFRLNNYIMGFLGWCLISFFEAANPLKKMIPGPFEDHISSKLRNLMIRLNNRLFLFVASAVYKTLGREQK